MDNERRLSEKEFTNGAPILINEWKIKIDDPKATFAELLKKNNAQAHITFTEFCDYIIKERLKQFDDLNNQDEI